jgi:Zn ribbon nucleic-acid-binding protein
MNEKCEQCDGFGSYMISVENDIAFEECEKCNSDIKLTQHHIHSMEFLRET